MNPLRFLFGIFSFVGLVSLIIWFPATFRAADKMMNWEKANATIVSVDPSGYPTISFRYNGTPYQFDSYNRGDNMQPGRELIIHFPPNEPKKAEIKSFFDDWFMSIFVGIFALVFGGVGLIGFSVILRKRKLKLELFDMGRGKRLTLPILEVGPDYSFRVNGRHPYVISTQFHDKTLNILHAYKSDYIWYDPSEQLAKRKDVDVYVDPNDFRRYYVDITFLPKKLSS